MIQPFGVDRASYESRDEKWNVFSLIKKVYVTFQNMPRCYVAQLDQSSASRRCDDHLRRLRLWLLLRLVRRDVLPWMLRLRFVVRSSCSRRRSRSANNCRSKIFTRSLLDARSCVDQGSSLGFGFDLLQDLASQFFLEWSFDFHAWRCRPWSPGLWKVINKKFFSNLWL